MSNTLERLGHDFVIDPHRLLPGTDIRLLQRALSGRLEPADDVPVRDPVELDQDADQAPAQQLAAAAARRESVLLREKLLHPSPRQPVNPGAENKYPFSAICCLRMSFPHGLFQGTGCLVAPDVVLTVAHNLYSRQHNASAAQVSVYRAANGMKVNSRVVTDAWFPPEYKSVPSSSKRRHDYAVLKLNSPYTSGGTLGIATYSDERFAASRNFHIVGYPLDKPDLTMWSHSRPTVSAGRDILRYTINTEEGNSGSPIIDRVDVDGQEFQLVVGIHSGFSDGRNEGVRMNDRVYQSIKSWLPSPS